MSLKWFTFPTKRLSQPISTSQLTFSLSDIKGWDGANITSANFGTRAFAVLRNSLNTQMEIVEFDPTTVASSPITIITRGLDFNGNAAAVTANQLSWPANDTLVDLGSDLPQLFNFLCMDLFTNQTVAGLKTYLTLPQSAVTPSTSADFATKAYVDSVVAGTATFDQNTIGGTAGETLAAGNGVYFKESDQRWWKWDSGATSTSTNVKIGIAQGSATAGNAITVLLAGLDKTLSGLTLGSKYYMSTAAGISTSPGAKSKFLGWAMAANRLLFYPTDLSENFVFALGGETIAAGDFVYLKASDQRWWKASASNQITSVNVQLAVAQTASTAGTAIIVRHRGVERNVSGLTGGSIYYLANASGTISTTAGTIGRQVGIAISANELLIETAYNADNTPPGEIRQYGGSTAPGGWLLCDGSAISRTNFATLFAAISTTYGAGDGSTTFNVPNAKGRVLIGLDASLKVQMFACESAFDEQVIANVTRTADSVDFKEGAASSKFVIAGAFTTGIAGSKAVGSLSLAGRTHISMWIKSDIATNNGDLQILLDDTANCASPLETINVPALIAATWTKIYLTLANPASDTAIISIGLNVAVDKGAQTVWLDDICKGDPFELGQSGGELRHQLTTPELASHLHTIGFQAVGTPMGGSGIATYASGTSNTSSAGGDLAHNTAIQYLTINHIIKI